MLAIRAALLNDTLRPIPLPRLKLPRGAVKRLLDGGPENLTLCLVGAALHQNLESQFLGLRRTTLVGIG